MSARVPRQVKVWVFRCLVRGARILVVATAATRIATCTAPIKTVRELYVPQAVHC